MRDRKGMNGSGWEARRGGTGRGRGKENSNWDIVCEKRITEIYSVKKKKELNKREKKKTYPKSSIFKKKQILNYWKLDQLISRQIVIQGLSQSWTHVLLTWSSGITMSAVIALWTTSREVTCSLDFVGQICGLLSAADHALPGWVCSGEAADWHTAWKTMRSYLQGVSLGFFVTVSGIQICRLFFFLKLLLSYVCPLWCLQEKTESNMHGDVLLDVYLYVYVLGVPLSG